MGCCDTTRAVVRNRPPRAVNASAEDLRNKFYSDRDLRSATLGLREAAVEVPVGIRIDEDVAATLPGQVGILALGNMLARVHRHIVVDVPRVPLLAKGLVAAGDLPEALSKTILAIDPFNTTAVTQVFPQGTRTIAFGTPERSVERYLGAEGFVGFLSDSPVAVAPAETTIFGVGLAACLGACALFRAVHGMKVAAARLSAWNLAEGAAAQSGPHKVPALDLGRVALIGAGAVASALAYWLRHCRVVGQWDNVDKDLVELHNTNRGLCMLAADAGWPNNSKAAKVDVLAREICARPFFGWYADWVNDPQYVRPDLLLPLANGPGFHHQVTQEFYPLLVHASTSRAWGAQLHRQIGGRDDCMSCRFRDVDGDLAEPEFVCSSAPVPVSRSAATDAALPFLSAAAGLMLTAALYRIMEGEREMSSGRFNHWSVDFDSQYRMIQGGQHQCSDTCANRIDPNLRKKIASSSRWASLISK